MRFKCNHSIIVSYKLRPSCNLKILLQLHECIMFRSASGCTVTTTRADGIVARQVAHLVLQEGCSLHDMINFHAVNDFGWRERCVVLCGMMIISSKYSFSFMACCSRLCSSDTVGSTEVSATLYAPSMRVRVSVRFNASL